MGYSHMSMCCSWPLQLWQGDMGADMLRLCWCVKHAGFANVSHRMGWDTSGSPLSVTDGLVMMSLKVRSGSLSCTRPCKAGDLRAPPCCSMQSYSRV